MSWTLVGVDTDGTEHVLQRNIEVPFPRGLVIVRGPYPLHRLKPGTAADRDSLMASLARAGA